MVFSLFAGECQGHALALPAKIHSFRPHSRALLRSFGKCARRILEVTASKISIFNAFIGLYSMCPQHRNVCEAPLCGCMSKHFTFIRKICSLIHLQYLCEELCFAIAFCEYGAYWGAASRCLPQRTTSAKLYRRAFHALFRRAAV